MSAISATTIDKNAATDLDGLEDRLGFVLRLAQLAVFQDLIASLRPWGLRVTDFSVLMVIGETPGLKQQAVGAVLQIQPPNLNAIMDRLQQQQLVLRTPVVGDRRSYALSLTEQGQHVLAQAKEAHAEHDRRLLARLDGLDVPVVLEALKRIAKL
jgi:DNA-binding MarR family transcriptional regulator